MWAWSVMKLTAAMSLRLVVALLAVADVFMFLLLFVNGVSDPAPRAVGEPHPQQCLPLQEGEQNETTHQGIDPVRPHLPGPVLRKETLYDFAAEKAPSKTDQGSVRRPCSGAYAASTAQNAGQETLPNDNGHEHRGRVIKVPDPSLR